MSTTTKTVPVRFQSESATGTGPAVLQIGGVEMASHTRSVEIRSAVGEVATVTAEVFALGGFDVNLPAAVTVNVLPLEEGTLDVTTLDDGTTRYHFVRKRDTA